MTDSLGPQFVETREYRRFVEFCEACRDYRYIGLCYGPPGVGKTLSAKHFTHRMTTEGQRKRVIIDKVRFDRVIRATVALYTVPVVNTPNQVWRDLSAIRDRLKQVLHDEIRRRTEPKLKQLSQHEKEESARLGKEYGYRSSPVIRFLEEVADHRYQLGVDESRELNATKDPTQLVIIDEADRLKMASLEQIRSIFDHDDVGMVLIGMPGLEKRLARYPQLYSRVGFVHQFRALSPADVQQLLKDGWRPQGVTLPPDALTDAEAIASIIRITGGNFRLLHRLLTQTIRVLEINEKQTVTPDTIDAARESLVIGAA